VCDLETSRMGAPYIYDISRLRVKDLHSATYIYVVRRLRVNAGEETRYPFYTRLGRPHRLDSTSVENLAPIGIRTPDPPDRIASILTQYEYFTPTLCWTPCAVWRIFITRRTACNISWGCYFYPSGYYYIICL